MEKTGFYDKLLFQSAVDWRNRTQLTTAQAYRAYTVGLAGMLAVFAQVHDFGDADMLVQSEELMVMREHALYGKEDPAVLPSLNAALADFAVMKKALQTVYVPRDYKIAATTYHDKEKRQGIVLDGFHKAVNSHIARLGNRLSAVGVALPEKQILCQRKINMQKAKTLYILLQRKALDDNC